MREGAREKRRTLGKREADTRLCARTSAHSTRTRVYTRGTHAGAGASAPASHTRVERDVRRVEGNGFVGTVRRLGSHPRKGGFLNRERRDDGGRGRERERRPEVRTNGGGGRRGEEHSLRTYVRVASVRRNARESLLALFLSLSSSISIRPRSMGYAAERRSKIDPRTDEGRDPAVRRCRARSSDPRAQ